MERLVTFFAHQGHGIGMVPLFGPVDPEDIELGIKNTDAILDTLEDAGQEALLFL